MNCRDISTLLQRTRWWGKAAAVGAFFALGLGANAQVTVTNPGNTTPGLAATYTSLADAVTALNAQTAISGPVTITLDPSNPQTAPAGGYIITATLTGASNTNRVTFAGSGNTITASAAHTVGAINDGIIKIHGSDFITISGFTLTENAANTVNTPAASNTMTEVGIALVYASTTNGCQGITISGNTIDLSRTYTNTFGIYSNSTHSATAYTTGATATGATGGNNDLTITGNTVTDVNQGIVVVGPTAAADHLTGLIIGGSGPNANTITNYGTAASLSSYANVSGTMNGILVRNAKNYDISFNSITSSAGGVTSGTLRGIFIPSFNNAPTGTITNNISSNTIALQSGSASGTVLGIVNDATTGNATTTLNINSNNFTQLNHSVSGTGAITGISNAMAVLNTNINSNTFTNITTNTTGSFTFITASYTMPTGGTTTANGNSISGTFNKTGAGGTITLFTNSQSSPAGTTHTFNNNNFSNITVTGATTIAGWSNNDGGAPTKNASGNTFSNWTGGTSAITGLLVSFSGAATVTNNTVSNISSAGSITGISTGSGTQTLTGNTVHTLTTTGASSVIGITCTGGTTNILEKNKVYNLEANNASGTVSGINVSSGTTVTLRNNLVGDLRAPIANAANPINGINVTGGTTVNAFYNSVYLNATSSGAQFGSTAMFYGTTTTFTARNNMLYNNSTAVGTGSTVALRRSSGTAAVVPTNYQAASNNNGFYAGAPGASNLLYAEGNVAPVNAMQTIVALKAFFVTRDQQSISENFTFQSTSGASANFLKFDTAVATGLESGAVNIGGITDDFANTVRQGNGGYAGTGTAPDIGAWELEGTPLALCSGTPATSTITGPASVCSGLGTTLGLSVTYTDLLISYQWRSGTTPGGPYSTTLGTSATQATGPLTADTYYICEVTCSNGGPFTMTTVEKSVLVNPLPSVTVNGVASATGSYCNPGGPAVVLTGGGAVSYTWSPTTGLTPTTGSPVSAAPTANTTYTVTGTDANGCIGTATAAITVTANPVITSTTATPNPTCFNGSSQLQVNTAASASYCTTFAISSTVEAISLVQFAGINNSSACATGAGAGGALQNFTAISGNVVAGSTYPMTLSGTTGGNFTNYFTAFFDWNQDGVFEDAQQIGFITNTACLANATNNVTVPAGAFNGTTRMRIVKDFVSGAAVPPPSLNYPSNPCGTFDFGQAEDYSINVTGGVDPYTYSWSPTTFISGQETLSNPLATGVNVASQAYTVTVTSAGCSSTGNVTVTTTAPITAATISGTLSYCAGGSTTLTAVPTDGAGPYTYVWTGPSGPEGTAVTQVADEPGLWSVVVSDNCGGTAPSVSVTVVENPLPTVAIAPTPANAAICGGVGNVALAASGASTYAWAPATGLSSTTGANVTSTATSTITYTVTGTDANGCVDTETQTVNVGANPVLGTPTATPSVICEGDNSNLSASGSVLGYTQGVGGSSFIDISASGTLVTGTIADDSEHNVTIPSFTYNGTAYTQMRVGNNGKVVLSVTSGEVGYANSALPYALSGLGATTAGNLGIMPWWDDLTPGTGNSIRTQTVGNLFIVQWTNEDHFDAPGTGTITFQLQLDLVTGVIYFAYSDVDFTGSAAQDKGGSATVGLQFSATSFLQSSLNVQTLANGQVISYTPNQPTWSWSPATFLSSTTVANPTATAITTLPITYTVTASSAIGCTSTANVTITEDLTDTDGDLITDCDDNCPTLSGQIGDYCDADPGAGFLFGQISGACTCDPVPCTENVIVDLRTDANSDEASWEILLQGSAQVVCQGGGYAPNITTPITETCCLPAGCFRLRVLDSGGDGFVTGGYQLRESGVNGRRIIDNFGNFNSGSVSALSSTYENGSFCVPIGDDKLIFSSCDKLDWVANKFIVASANPAVSAQFGVTNTTSGYEFWFFDPNGTYSYRRFRSHATTDGFGTGATRACHFKVNGWINSVSTPHLPSNVLLNVRVRGRVAGNDLPFGPACLFKIDAALAACPRVKLQDDPANTSDFSCGVFRNFGGASNPNNRITAAPPQPIPAVASSNVRYQFRFRIPAENICIVRPPQTSARLVLNWTTGTPLQCSKTYEVDVRVSLDGGATWCFGPVASSEAAACADTEAWGKVCLVTINPCALPNGGGNSMVVEGNNTFTMYPNPNRGDQLFLSVSNVEEGVNTVNVDIFDMAGKRVMARTIAVQDGFVNTNMELNGELAGGLYVVNITAGTKAYTERLVIQP
jgi:hypothetical protein